MPKDANPQDHYDVFQGVSASNIPASSHWVDETKPDSFVVISQPAGLWCAALGGIMASRIRKVGAHGVVVGGRIRDVGELSATQLPVSPRRIIACRCTWHG